MIQASKDERVAFTMAMALDYVTSYHSMRTLAAKYGIGKTTVHQWLTTVLPTIDPQLSSIVERKISFFKKQDYYSFKLNSRERITLAAFKRTKYRVIIKTYSKDFKDPKKFPPSKKS
jgi:hypothetical protein